MSVLAFWTRAQPLVVGFGALYLATVALLTIPWFQSQAVYLHSARLPLFAEYECPEKYGLARNPNKTRNLYIRTPDGETLGAWFVLSDAYYQSAASLERSWDDDVRRALEAYPTILFLHGNAATRAQSTRVMHYSMFSSRLHANVLVIDYRGFGDSTGTPSESGLATDARAAWGWLIENGARQEDVVVMGHSLGTGVAGRLTADLEREGSKPRGLVLLNPFTSMLKLLETYQFLGVVPLLGPLHALPFVPKLVAMILRHQFDTISLVPKFTTDIIIASSDTDIEIPASHAEALFDAFIAPHLPPEQTPPAGCTQHTTPCSPLRCRLDWKRFIDEVAMRKQMRADLVHTTEILRFGTMSVFIDDAVANRKVLYVRTHVGGHNEVGLQEGLQDIIGSTMGFLSSR
ncbi:alpha/beta-hydrolase [Fistulina hepatica ATCC 64428]|uniref:Alpha/beta-hydrolase n=1 Tax=Fistulina hepatica ATCC 64428 TaxID=1128425 RepID=A0A0D7APM6_9AGAR|nr:alpha/beta-hydrolase [Fistulina hepatica ATCC 64428]